MMAHAFVFLIPGHVVFLKFVFTNLIHLVLKHIARSCFRIICLCPWFCLGPPELGQFPEKSLMTNDERITNANTRVTSSF